MNCVLLPASLCTLKGSYCFNGHANIQISSRANLTLICNCAINSLEQFLFRSLLQLTCLVEIPAHLTKRPWVSRINPLIFIAVIITFSWNYTCFAHLPSYGRSVLMQKHHSEFHTGSGQYCWNRLSAAQEPRLTLKNHSFLGPQY